MTQRNNTKAEAPTFTVERFPSRLQERVRLASEAEEIPAAELRDRAEALGVDTAGARTKKEVTERVRGTGSAEPGA